MRRGASAVFSFLPANSNGERDEEGGATWFPGTEMTFGHAPWAILSRRECRHSGAGQAQVIQLREAAQTQVWE